ncbi:MAG: 2TM domain-containing protein [Burkholderiaceae bacterium]
MATPMTAEEIEHVARKRAGAKLGWYVHASVYLVVNGGMFLASMYGLRQRPWTIYPAMGWGLGLTLHGIAVFLLGSGSSLRERLVQKERDRLQNRQRER